MDRGGRKPEGRGRIIKFGDPFRMRMIQLTMVEHAVHSFPYSHPFGFRLDNEAVKAYGP